MSKEIKFKEKQVVRDELCQKDQNITEINCQRQPLPNWLKWLGVVLIIAIFIIACLQLHYLWKLTDITLLKKSVTNLANHNKYEIKN